MVTVKFKMEPEEPDPDDRTGVSEAEYERVTQVLMQQLGAEDIEIEGVVE